MLKLGWKQCAVLASNDAYGTGVASTFQNSTLEVDITVKVIGYFPPTSTDFTAPLRSIKNSGAKLVILAAIAGQGGRRCLKQAAQMGMLGSNSGFTWIIAEGTASLPLLLSPAFANESSLSTSDFEQALLGNLGTRPQGGHGELWNQTVTTWLSGHLDPTLFPGAGSTDVIETDIYMPYAFDTVYTVAHAYLSLATQALPVTGPNLRNALRNTDFVGVTGRVQFDEHFDRNAPYSIMNIQNTASLFVQVGTWTAEDGASNLSISEPIIWPDGTQNIPSDGLPHTLYFIKWNSVTSIVLLSFAGVCTLLMISTSAIVGVYADTPVIRLASPWFLIITLFGLAVLFGSIFAWMGEPTNASCTVRIWLGFIGFVMAFAALIVKTYRVFVIFRRRRKVKRIVVTNIQLVKYVLVIMLPVVILLVVWTAIDMSRPAFIIDVPNNRINVVCRSKSAAWLIGGLVYCALLMLVSLALSWKTRRVPGGFNETWYVYLSGYNTILMGVIGVAVGYILGNNPLALTVIVSVTILFGGMVLWGLLFLPKLYICFIAKERNTISLQQSRDMRHPSQGSSFESTSDMTDEESIAGTIDRSDDLSLSGPRRQQVASSVTIRAPSDPVPSTRVTPPASNNADLSNRKHSASASSAAPVGSAVSDNSSRDKTSSLPTSPASGRGKRHPETKKNSDKLPPPYSTSSRAPPASSNLSRRKPTGYDSETSSSHGEPVEEMGAAEMAHYRHPAPPNGTTDPTGSKDSRSRTKDPNASSSSTKPDMSSAGTSSAECSNGSA